MFFEPVSTVLLKLTSAPIWLSRISTRTRLYLSLLVLSLTAYVMVVVTWGIISNYLLHGRCHKLPKSNCMSCTHVCSIPVLLLGAQF